MDQMSLNEAIKQLIIAECFHEDDGMTSADIDDAALLFGSSSPVGLDSLDALQLSVSLKKHYGVRIEGARDGQIHLASVNAIAACIRAHQAVSA